MSTPAEALARAIADLETAKRLLEEIASLGVWSRSYDSSDNRRRREGLRETDWAVSGAHRELAGIPTELRDARLDALETDLRSLVARLEPLPDTVSDTMADDDLTFYVAVRNLTDEVERLHQRAIALAGAAAPLT
jgi:hypothetical protein